MMRFFSFLSKPLSLEQLPLKGYVADFSLDRLIAGIDGIHIDVSISPLVCSLIRQAVSVSLVKQSHSEQFLEANRTKPLENDKVALRRICRNILQEGIEKAKAKSEVQIDFLGQFSLAKLIIEEINQGYQSLLARLEMSIRSLHYDKAELFRVKEKLFEIKHDRNRIIRSVGEELFQILSYANARNLKHIRESNFPVRYILPDDFFNNPTLLSDNVADDFLLTDAYTLLSQRSEEPDNYATLISLIRTALSKTDLVKRGARDGKAENRHGEEPGLSDSDGDSLDAILKEANNIDLLFNYSASREAYEKAKSRNAPGAVLLDLQSRMKTQEALFNALYQEFRKGGLLDLVMAGYEVKNLYRNYWPPLRPLKLREYLVSPGSRKNILRELKRPGSFSGKNISLAPLRTTIRRIDHSSTRKKKEALLKFLKDFLRYHRDLGNGVRLRRAMEAINLIQDEKKLLLSKNNQLLYEFTLPEEKVKEDKPVIGHVIIKADIRGSIDITRTMAARGLSPASYFSLNFYNPITELIRDYDANKEFIEGDAIILSIFEKEDNVTGWYSVARACALAANILNIVRQCNGRNQKHGLPALELGIGICYRHGPPSYLFDGDSRIMISDAINCADRLSSCSRKLRKRLNNQENMFNLQVFHNARSAEDGEEGEGDLVQRYNVNGIELDHESFRKLIREINLERRNYPRSNEDSVTLYTGKVPTVSGNFQRLVIREATISEIHPETLEVAASTAENYYEVCTQPQIMDFIRSLDNQE